MVAVARQRARDEGLSEDSITVSSGDVHSLDFPSEHFDAVVALGVIPWLHSPKVAVAEMARTLRPGGLLVVTADNRYRLIHLLDPWLNPLVVPAKRFARARLDRRRHSSTTGVRPRYDRIGEIDRLLRSAGLAKIRGETVGFGPFTVGRRTVPPDDVGTRLHGALQRLADRGILPFRTTGAHYVVMSRKTPPQGDIG
jgi:ubiquinone/menaquinone biosynthesis C-methylase UbiE